jgi:hypothetical protein
MKKVLLDLYVLDFIIENEFNTAEEDKVTHYKQNLLIYGQQEIYQIYYLPKQIVLCKKQIEIQALLQINGAIPLPETQTHLSAPSYAAMAQLSQVAHRFNPEISEDISKIRSFKPFQRNKFNSLEYFQIMFENEMDYLLTLDPFVKLDWLYLKEAVQSLQKIQEFKISVH